MKYFFYVFFIYILHNSLFAQKLERLSENNTLLNSAQKYESKDYQGLNGHEIVDDYSGNFILKYSTPLKVPSELADDFTIEYNPNVQTNMHYIYENYDNRVGNNINTPVWILGYKGIALQTFNFEVYYTTVGNSGEDVPLLIPGYHYTNKIAFFSALQETEYITVLLADGSTKRLQNANPQNGLTGIFVEEGINNKGFAIVEYQGANTILRNIYYKPGDGLTYLFQEEFVHYRWATNYGGSQAFKIMYLKKIYNANTNDGSELEFIYTDQLTSHIYLNYLEPDKPVGRKILKEIKSNRTDPTGAEKVLEITYSEASYGSNQYYPYKCELKNFSIDDLITLNFDNEFISKNLLCSGGNYSRTYSTSRNLFVYSISNNIGETDIFNRYGFSLSDHEFTTRKYAQGTNPPIYIEYFHNYLINEIQYFKGNKTTIEYWDKFFDGIPRPDYSIALYDETNLQQCAQNINLAFRDCYTTFMIKSKKNYNKFGSIESLVSSEEYLYSRNGSSGLRSANVNNIFTEISVKNELDNSLTADKSKRIIKNYSRKRTIEKDGNTLARIPLITLMCDSTIENDFAPMINLGITSMENKVANRYDYDFGSFHSSISGDMEAYFDGTFRTIKKTSNNYNTTSSDPINSIETNFAVTNESNLSFTGGLFNKKIILTTQETDPNQVINEKTFTNFIPSSPVSTVSIDFYYDINKPNYEKVYKATQIKSYKKNDYYTTESNGEFKGKLKRITENLSNPTYLDFNYYTNDENSFYRGYLKSTNNNNGVTTEYYYPDVIDDNELSSSAIGIVKQYNGSTQSKTFTHTGFQLQPFKTINKLNGVELYTTYSSYNAKGLLAFGIDKDGYYSRYHYDDLGRITSVCLPGSFKDFSDIPLSDGSDLYSYDDANKIITETKRMDNTPGSLKSIETKKEYDAFGQIRKISSKNDAGNFELKSTYAYNYLGKPSYEEDASAHKKWYKYDYLSRLIDTRYVQNSTTIHKTISYNLQANPTTYYEYVTFTDEIGKVEKKYFDKIGNLLKEEKIDGTTLTTSYAYDAIYNLLNVTFPKGDITSYQYDSHNNIKLQTVPEQGTKNYMYDKFKNLRFEYNSSNLYLVTFNKYDKLNRVLLSGFRTVEDHPRFLDPDYDYSISGHSFAHFENYNTDIANFVLVNMYDSYNPAGVFTGITPPGFPAAGMNLKGKLVMTAFRDKTTDPWNYKAYTYDHLGRVASSWLKYGSSTWFQINTGYDNAGNITTQDVTSSFYWWYNYDKQGRLTNVKTNAVNNLSTAKNDASFTYYLNNQPDVTTFNMIGRENQYKVYYDSRGRVDNILAQFGNYVSGGGDPTKMGAGWTTIFQEDLSYFNNNNISNAVITNYGSGSWPTLSFNYTYGLNRLSNSNCTTNSAYSESYSYDNNGNLSTKSRTGTNFVYQYNNTSKKNQLTNLLYNGNSKSFVYDYKGNMTSDGLALLYPTDFNRFNLTTKVVNSISRSVDYRYDETGNRIYKGGFNTNPELYLIDHSGRQLAVLDGLNNYRIKMANIYGNGLIGKVNVTYNAQNVRTDARQYYYKDHLGSVRVVFDETSAIVCAQDYYPYGEIMRSYVTGSNLNDKFKFTEKERDTETNYDYFGARYYSSILGRFLSVDPLAIINPGLSPYCYADNNPINLIDLLGFDASKPTASDRYSYEFFTDREWSAEFGSAMDPSTYLIRSYSCQEVDCDKLYNEIVEIINGGLSDQGLSKRWQEMDIDKEDFYLNGDRRWRTHQNQYNDRQKGLKNKLKKYDDNCPDDDGNKSVEHLRTWLTIEPPAKPNYMYYSPSIIGIYIVKYLFGNDYRGNGVNSENVKEFLDTVQKGLNGTKPGPLFPNPTWIFAF